MAQPSTLSLNGRRGQPTAHRLDLPREQRKEKRQAQQESRATDIPLCGGRSPRPLALLGTIRNELSSAFVPIPHFKDVVAFAQLDATFHLLRRPAFVAILDANNLDLGLV